MESGWDPEIKKYFIKILNSIALGLLWLMAMLTIGLYVGMATEKGLLYKIIFYLLLFITLGLLLRYYYRTWKK